ncbi:MAG: hypothetical protein ACTSR8_18930 [Promethearchaeota archaeon]
MCSEIIKSLKNSLNKRDSKRTYTSLLKFFKDLEEFRHNNESISLISQILMEYHDDLFIDEKKVIIEKSISELYHKADLIKEDFSEQEKRTLFFKKQIRGLFSRNLNQIILLLNEYEKIHSLRSLIIFLLSYLQYDAKEELQILFNIFKNNILSQESFIRLINPVFDKYPKETLKTIINLIHEISDSDDNTDINLIQSLYLILLEQSEIYPDIFYEEIDVFLDMIKLGLNSNEKNYEVLAEIYMNVVANRDELFIADFFKLLEISYRISKNNWNKVKYFLENSIKTIFQNHSVKVFKYFNKKLEKNLPYLLNLMNANNPTLNDIIIEFFIDYLEYQKIFNYNGKITKPLLQDYLNILKTLSQKELYNEFFIFSVVYQLDLKQFDYSNLLSLSSPSKDQGTIETYYKKIINELDEYLNIIF